MSEINIKEEEGKKSLNFIEAFVESDLAAGKNGKRIQTRFPPEPNGYLHIGHAKAICLDFGIAERYNGICNLRFDDTNPVKEDVEYVDSIMEDIKWLGFHWENVYYASDYFPQLWDFAVRLIKEGKAYVDEQSAEIIAQQKGTPTQPGTNSPFRDRPVEESLDLFNRMNQGDFEEGSMVLRAKIDMASSNMHFRDPIIYRIIKHPHHRTGTAWKAYPMYDFAHGESDYFEGVTHSLCTLEFEVHRPLYDYFIDQLKESDDRAREGDRPDCNTKAEFDPANRHDLASAVDNSEGFRIEPRTKADHHGGQANEAVEARNQFRHRSHGDAAGNHDANRAADADRNQDLDDIGNVMGNQRRGDRNRHPDHAITVTRLTGGRARKSA